MDVEGIISTAGRRNYTVQLRVETRRGQVEAFEVEPYASNQKGLRRLLFCLDVNTFEYLNIDLSLIRAAEMTRNMFTPRFPIIF